MGAQQLPRFHPGFKNSVAATQSVVKSRNHQRHELKEYGLEIVKSYFKFSAYHEANYLKLGGGLENTNEFKRFSEKDAARLPEYYDRIEAVADVLRDLSIKTPQIQSKV